MFCFDHNKSAVEDRQTVNFGCPARSPHRLAIKICNPRLRVRPGCPTSILGRTLEYIGGIDRQSLPVSVKGVPSSGIGYVSRCSRGLLGLLVVSIPGIGARRGEVGKLVFDRSVTPDLSRITPLDTIGGIR